LRLRRLFWLIESEVSRREAGIMPSGAVGGRQAKAQSALNPGMQQLLLLQCIQQL